MKKILLICDKPNWAYDSIARSIKKYNTDSSIQLDIVYIKGDEKKLKGIAKENRYDLYFFIGWQLLAKGPSGIFRKKYRYKYPFIKPDKVITGIHSHHAWDNRETRPDKSVSPPKELIRFLGRFRGVNAVSLKLHNIFKQNGLEKCVYTPNGVDTEIFKSLVPLAENGQIKAGYSGSLKHDWRKGLTDFIEPASKKAGVTLIKAVPSGNHYIPLKEMPRFYNSIDLYLCASSSEGFSLSVLEASACGRPVISTRVGGSEDLITDGENGFFVRRDIDAIVEKLNVLKSDANLLMKMGTKNREVVEKKWSWKIRTESWIEFIRNSI